MKDHNGWDGAAFDRWLTTEPWSDEEQEEELDELDEEREAELDRRDAPDEPDEPQQEVFRCAGCGRIADDLAIVSHTFESYCRLCLAKETANADECPF